MPLSDSNNNEGTGHRRTTEVSDGKKELGGTGYSSEYSLQYIC